MTFEQIAETVNDKPLYKQVSIWIAFIAFFGTFINGYMLFKTSKTQHEFDRIQVIIDHLSEEVDKARIRDEKNLKTIIEQGIQIIDLTSQLQDKTSQAELLEGFIEALPFPAWIKEREKDGLFSIVTINEKFTVFYGLTKRNAVGFNDYDLYPKDLAEEYQRGDQIVFESKKDFRAKTEIPKNGVRVPVEYIKFVIKLPSGFEGIGGMVIE